MISKPTYFRVVAIVTLVIAVFITIFWIRQFTFFNEELTDGTAVKTIRTAISFPVMPVLMFTAGIVLIRYRRASR